MPIISASRINDNDSGGWFQTCSSNDSDANFFVNASTTKLPSLRVYWMKQLHARRHSPTFRYDLLHLILGLADRLIRILLTTLRIRFGITLRALYPARLQCFSNSHQLRLQRAIQIGLGRETKVQSGNAFEAELVAVREALKLAWDKGARKGYPESDSSAVNEFESPNPINPRFGWRRSYSNVEGYGVGMELLHPAYSQGRQLRC
ncbi:hypothetical protein OIU85_007170 [Salix viminalis]|uniref:RNase H type-1 domain-containing protein n=1 Tax=Salix viminalis TaxID=40686 RepID=A0A9Q0P8A2_SALVM|nr:hypothetical protein OIU85_007170 [Salix viminalis]